MLLCWAHIDEIRKHIRPSRCPTSSSSSSNHPSPATSPRVIINFPLLNPQETIVKEAKMHYTNVLALAIVFAGSAVALPWYDEECQTQTVTKTATQTVTKTATKTATKTVTKTAHATTVNQTNNCGNGAMPYCCNTDNGGQYTTCSAMGKIARFSLPVILFHASPEVLYIRSHHESRTRLTQACNRRQLPVLSDYCLLQCQQRKSPSTLPFLHPS